MSLLMLSACDVGHHYKPKDWTPVSDLQWKQTFGPAEIQWHNLGGLVGEKVTDIGMLITNHSDNSFVAVKSAILKTGKGEYSATKGSKLIAPGETRVDVIFWTFKEPLIEVLVDPVEIQLTLQIGEQESLFIIPMVEQ
jgi:hypothetical protein